MSNEEIIYDDLRKVLIMNNDLSDGEISMKTFPVHSIINSINKEVRRAMKFLAKGFIDEDNTQVTQSYISNSFLDKRYIDIITNSPHVIDKFNGVTQPENIYTILEGSWRERRAFNDKQIDAFSLYLSGEGSNEYLNDRRSVQKEKLKLLLDEYEKRFKNLDKSNNKYLNQDLFIQLWEGSKEYFQKQFDQLDISEILTPNWKTESLNAGIKLDDETNSVSLLKGVEQLREESNRNCLLIGEGGMGKTYSLVTIWKHYLNESKSSKVIPIYIPLHRYNDASKKERKSFIVSYILKKYLNKGVITEQIESEFWDTLLQEQKSTDYEIILLLDGFNEITRKDIDIRKDLDDWWFSKFNNIQVIITSRYDIRHDNRWHDLRKIELQPLTGDSIKEHLDRIGIKMPEDKETQDLLSNPMMLSLYCSSHDNFNKYNTASDFDFKYSFTSQGELMWNFFESQLVKQYETKTYDDEGYSHLSFISKHLVPFIGFMMEANGQYNIPEDKLVRVINEGCIIFNTENFVDTFPIYREYHKEFDLGEMEFSEYNSRFVKIKEILCEKLQILVETNHDNQFIHQNFRDFSASVHVINDLVIANKGGETAQTLKERPLPVYIRKFIGEIDGEHKKKVILKKKSGK